MGLSKVRNALSKKRGDSEREEFEFSRERRERDDTLTAGVGKPQVGSDFGLGSGLGGDLLEDIMGAFDGLLVGGDDVNVDGECGI